MMLDGPESTRSPAARRSANAPPNDHPRTFAWLYRSYFGFTWRVVGQLGVPSHAIDDVVQEVWLVVHRRLPSFEGRSALKSWLFGVSLNVARNQRRSDRRRQKHVPEPLSDVQIFDPERIREGREAWERVERFMSSLDDRRRAIFIHQLIENRSALETAEAVHEDVLSIYRQVRLLRASFRRWLRRELEGGVARPRRSRRSLPERPPAAFTLQAPCSGR